MNHPIYVGNKPVGQLDSHAVVQGNWAWGVAELLAGAAMVRLASRDYLRWGADVRDMTGPEGRNDEEWAEDHALTARWLPIAGGLYLMFGGATILAKRVAYVVPKSNSPETGGGCGCSQNKPQF